MATIKKYKLGQLITLTAKFTVGGVYRDPDIVTITVLLPDEATRYEKSYPADAEIVRDSAGIYHLDFSPTQAGLHTYQGKSTTPAQSLQESVFRVEKPRIM